jgi:TorA maturation chaperone TorD
MSDSAATTASLPPTIEPEDAARAGFYALLARLYTAGPDAALLASMRAAGPLPKAPGEPRSADPADVPDLATAWDALRAACLDADEGSLRQEYDELFVGVGKSEVNLHASHWLTGFMMEKPLAEVRASLARLGLARRVEVTMVEDHLASLCETMRILIAGQGNRRPASFAEQKKFFEAHFAVWTFECCNAISVCPLASFYRHAAQFTIAFLALERDSFAMD